MRKSSLLALIGVALLIIEDAEFLIHILMSSVYSVSSVYSEYMEKLIYSTPSLIRVIALCLIGQFFFYIYRRAK